jgi:hypothetical protein
VSRANQAHHCGGFRLVRGDPPRIVDVHGRACRSAEGLCACPCSRCVRARECKHDQGTFLSMGSMVPLMPEVRFDFGHGRAKREDGTDYVGPTVTARPREPDDPKPKAVSWKSEVCIACGMRIRGTKREEA